MYEKYPSSTFSQQSINVYTRGLRAFAVINKIFFYSFETLYSSSQILQVIQLSTAFSDFEKKLSATRCHQ